MSRSAVLAISSFLARASVRFGQPQEQPREDRPDTLRSFCRPRRDTALEFGANWVRCRLVKLKHRPKTAHPIALWEPRSTADGYFG